MGSEATGVASTFDTRANSSEDKPKPATENFPLFSCKPEKSKNISNMVETWCAAPIDPHKKNVVSSQYCSNEMSPGRPVVWNPPR